MSLTAEGDDFFLLRSVPIIPVLFHSDDVGWYYWGQVHLGGSVPVLGLLLAACIAKCAAC